MTDSAATTAAERLITADKVAAMVGAAVRRNLTICRTLLWRMVCGIICQHPALSAFE